MKVGKDTGDEASPTRRMVSGVERFRSMVWYHEKSLPCSFDMGRVSCNDKVTDGTILRRLMQELVPFTLLAGDPVTRQAVAYPGTFVVCDCNKVGGFLEFV